MLCQFPITTGVINNSQRSRAVCLQVMTDLFALSLPKIKALPILANIPHSGLLVPSEIASQLNEQHRNFLPNQDWHLDKLYDFLPDLGITVLQAHYSRYVVDLNRSLKEPLFGSFWQSAVPQRTAFDVPLYKTMPSQAEIEWRVEQYYKPYHHKLQSLLDQFIDQFGTVYLLDLHSFLGLITDDVCLGNVNGKSCSADWMATIERAFCSMDYGVVCNKVFNGGYITQHYGTLSRVEALQIELRYPTYLNAEQLDRSSVPEWDVPKFQKAKQTLESIFRQIVE